MELVIIIMWFAIMASVMINIRLVSNGELKDLEIDSLKIDVAVAQDTARRASRISMSNPFVTATKALPEMDKTTKNLIKLAVNNSNENEARTAALKACKRLYEKVK